MRDIQQVQKSLMSKTKDKPVAATDMLSTGSTLINLACTGKALYGFIKGLYYFLVGDSSSGKTFLSMTCLAEAAKNPNFDNYRFIHDDVEHGALMNLVKFFGQKVADRIEAPSYINGEPIFSTTVDEFYDHLDDAINEEKPFIYILDSMDSLTSEEALTKYKEQKKARRAGKEASGSYGDGKAKINSQNLRRALHYLRSTGSILIIISQTRDNLGFGAMFEPKTRAGGKALKFYAALELWSSVVGKLKKKVKGTDRQIGIVSRIKVKKNRLTGQEHTIDIPIYHSYGIDDLGSCIDYLIKEGHWKATKGTFRASEFDFVGNRESLIREIEEDKREKELRLLVGKVWKEIQTECVVERKRRYD